MSTSDQQNGHSSRPRDLHRLSQNIHQALMQWYQRQMMRQEGRPAEQDGHQQNVAPSEQPQQHHHVVVEQPQLHQPQPLVTYRVVRRPREGLMSKLPPYLRRGTTVCCGCRMSGASILPLFVLGSIMVFIGIFVLTSGSSGTSGFLLMAGVLLVLFYVLLCRKARKEFEALPPDHPDRLYYSSPRQHVRVFSSTQLPPNTQVVHFASSSSPYPPTHTQMVHLSPLPPPMSRTGLPPEAQMGHFPTPPDTPQRTGIQSRAPPYESLRPYEDDDKPPAYEDIFKDV